MNFEKLNPWNWFKDEENHRSSNTLPITRHRSERLPSHSALAHPILQMQQQMERLFDDVFQAFGGGLPANRWGNTMREDFRPQLDVAGDAEKYDIALNVPGLSEEDLAIELDGDILTIRGQREEKNESKDKHYYRIERSVGTFQRTLSLPKDADADAIAAKLKDGVLCLTIPRKQSSKGDVKRILIGS